MEGLVLRSRVVPRRPPHPYALRNNRVRPQGIPQLVMGVALMAFGLAPQAPPAPPRRGKRRRRDEDGDEENVEPPLRRARVLTDCEVTILITANPQRSLII
ncbi:uncharacterized protein LOC120353995 [Nilaparvata lugens]|uniref:uncharacterized protein LOC120353995 n=1 Tax=Nilaparvata lugens TaxID=108931 RepID=UPI00193D9185|nr:uncharacterized protein LOC120353995 [Nilaparvata lugens]XP_039295612.1 uncharacterized protein LOC120353995 [Nilaparvata lugens]XP_039295613.1 uncharacterized protein LOC120353995 [Nilaparvata lugens]